MKFSLKALLAFTLLIAVGVALTVNFFRPISIRLEMSHSQTLTSLEQLEATELPLPQSSTYAVSLPYPPEWPDISDCEPDTYWFVPTGVIFLKTTFENDKLIAIDFWNDFGHKRLKEFRFNSAKSRIELFQIERSQDNNAMNRSRE